MTERLWALRREQREQRGRGGSAHQQRIQQTYGDGNLGAIYALSADMQSLAVSRKRTAGPVPPSWWSDLQKRQSQRPSAKASPSPAIATSPHKVTLKPMSFREECLLCILTNLNSNKELQDAVAFGLPFSLRQDLLRLASSCASLDDMALDSLLFNHEVAGEPFEDDENSSTAWEESTEPIALAPERLIMELDLSNSKVSLAMLTSILRHAGDASDEPRLPRLRKLNLARTPLNLNQSVVKLFLNYSLASLCLTGLQCTLFEPLKVLSKALPYLRDLDISQSNWLSWDDLQHLDWSTRWRELESINLANCEQLSPSASYLDPEARSSGPPVIMQIMSLVRDKGRTKWLDVIA